MDIDPPYIIDTLDVASLNIGGYAYSIPAELYQT